MLRRLRRWISSRRTLQREVVLLRLQVECLELQLAALQERETACREWVAAFHAMGATEVGVNKTALSLMGGKPG